LKLPPLRERKEDIPLLVNHFLRKHREESKGRSLDVSDRALSVLQRYDWPGNVRELENCIVRAMVLANSEVIEVEDLPPELHDREVCVPTVDLRTWEDLKAVKKVARERVSEEIEREFVEETLRRNRGNVSRSALEMGMDRRQLQNMIRRYRINPQDYY